MIIVMTILVKYYQEVVEKFICFSFKMKPIIFLSFKLKLGHINNKVNSMASEITD